MKLFALCVYFPFFLDFAVPTIAGLGIYNRGLTVILASGRGPGDYPDLRADYISAQGHWKAPQSVTATVPQRTA